MNSGGRGEIKGLRKGGMKKKCYDTEEGKGVHRN